ncbi:glycosyl hydrolase family 28-related protein [Sulfitobacter sp. D35]|uniref:glycosyl hydrolase family 28-related protein n=1 Tax=Sulfitobacter sp. D35 TaxID=3083252 RepID=UPI00296F9990|nr:glycosyl hydrolase family 28-related protein [Sulfitobacter sp. D35]MDW4498437.1 glycosyl hydrolase family 28-related protein [Sulfitobacter sp. D35]
MNKAITDGVQLMPPPFAGGLDVWSSGDGTPGSDTYSAAANAAFVPADQDFGGCLELLKSAGTERLRYMGETPILPGCYLRITARVKAISGNLPSVRIAAFAGGAGGVAVPGVTVTGPSVALTAYGQITEVSAIVGAGLRGGVDMVWGPSALYGHFGIDLTGQTGGVVRIDDLVIEDVTSAFLRDMLSVVDVRDFGAVGDGSTDDTAFEAANLAANGRTVLIPKGTYRLNSDVTFDAPTRFEGTVSMPTSAILFLRGNFDFRHYLAAFGTEETAFRKGFQALLNNADHDTFDLCGRKVAVTAPIDMQAAVPNRDSYATRRVIRNGQLEAQGDSAWDKSVVTSQATYSSASNKVLSNVVNVANVEVGALVTGAGVGREVYVRAVNVGAQEVTLSAALHDAEGTQTYTFTRHRYMLDFSGFSALSKFVLADLELQCNSIANGVLLAPAGIVFQLQDCSIARPRDRGLTSCGTGCQGLHVDRCQFLSSEDSLDVADRVSIALNANSNDVKLRDNRATRFRHFALLGGGHNIVTGNHFFQGDGVPGGIRSAGLILAKSHILSVVTGNYVDNCYVEWTNERDANPEFSSEFSFSALTLSNNIFLSSDVASWFTYIVVKPYGPGHFLAGVTITGNHFRTQESGIDRVEKIDDGIAAMDFTRFKDVTFAQNSFHNVTTQISNPLHLRHVQSTEAETWVIDSAGLLPFGAEVRSVDAVVPHGPLQTGLGLTRNVAPNVSPAMGTGGAEAHLTWGEALRGEVQATLRIDV